MTLLSLLLTPQFWLSPPVLVLILAALLYRQETWRGNRELRLLRFLLRLLLWGAAAAALYLALLLLLSLLFLSIRVSSLMVFVPWAFAAGAAIGLAVWRGAREQLYLVQGGPKVMPEFPG